MTYLFPFADINSFDQNSAIFSISLYFFNNRIVNNILPFPRIFLITLGMFLLNSFRIDDASENNNVENL